jgi:hypothetical protein
MTTDAIKVYLSKGSDASKKKDFLDLKLKSESASIRFIIMIRELS